MTAGRIGRDGKRFNLFWTDGNGKAQKNPLGGPALALIDAVVGVSHTKLNPRLAQVDVTFEGPPTRPTLLTFDPAPWLAESGISAAPPLLTGVVSATTSALEEWVREALVSPQLLAVHRRPHTDQVVTELVSAVHAATGDAPVGIAGRSSWNSAATQALIEAVRALPPPVGPKPTLQFHDGFRYPAHYVRTPPRDLTSEHIGDLGERDLASVAGHHQAHPGRYHGTFTVRFHPVTPVLLLDHERPVALPGDHSGYTTRLDIDQLPVVTPTSVRGLIRSLVRAATNSRFQTLPDGPRGGYRLDTSAARRLVPVQLHHVGGTWEASVFTGTNVTLSPDGDPGTGPQHAAWVPIWPRRLLLPGHVAPLTGTEVDAEMTLTHHGGKQQYDYWQVTRIRIPGGAWGPAIPLVDNDDRWAVARTLPKIERGLIYATGRTARNKHDDRLFFVAGATPNAAPRRHVDQWVIADFDGLLSNYAKPPLERDSPLPSPVIPPYIAAQQHAVDGMLTYARVEGGQIVSLHPALLPRAMHPKAIAHTVHATLHPPIKASELSTADRLFGWVKQNGSGSFASRVSIVDVDSTALKVQPSDPQTWMPLAIQVSPKNTPRLAGSPDSSGGPHPEQAERHTMAWGVGDNTIRGHKIWVAPTGPELHPEWFRFQRDEQAPYQRGPVARNASHQDHLNRSIDSWIRSGHLDVTVGLHNLDSFELGVFVWLFDPSPGRPVLYRLGLGKSLGFGAVRAEMCDVEIHDTEQLHAHWFDLSSAHPTRIDRITLANSRESFKNVVDAAYPGLLADLDRIRRGYTDGKPLVPPRNGPSVYLNQKLWFAINESPAKDRPWGNTLGEVNSNAGFPFFEQ